jgi:DNA-binding IclR family transcriptional regulator
MRAMKTGAGSTPLEAEDGDAGESDPPVKSVDRAARLLKAIAAHPHGGAMLIDLSRETGLGRATTHRLLAALIDTGFVFQDIGNRRYRLGSAFTALGRNALTQEIATTSQAILERIARETGDTVYLSVPEGSAAICLGRAVGAFPIRTLTLSVGDRRPLGVGGGSLALLAAMPDAHVAKVVERNVEWTAQFPGYDSKMLLDLVTRTRREGYARNEGQIVAGMGSVGLPVLNAAGAPIASLSVAAITDRVSGERKAMLVDVLRREAAVLAAQLAEDSTPTIAA